MLLSKTLRLPSMRTIRSRPSCWPCARRGPARPVGHAGLLATGRPDLPPPAAGGAGPAIRDWLIARGEAWVEDPSNADVRFTAAHPGTPAAGHRSGVPAFTETFAPADAAHAAQAQAILCDLGAQDLVALGLPWIDGLQALLPAAPGQRAAPLAATIRNLSASTAQLEAAGPTGRLHHSGPSSAPEDRPGIRAPAGRYPRVACRLSAESGCRRSGWYNRAFAGPGPVGLSRRVRGSFEPIRGRAIPIFPASHHMALIVHKYGGDRGSTERIRSVARRVAKWARAGHQMVVVPSAMSGETNRLLGLAKELAPSRRTQRTTANSTCWPRPASRHRRRCWPSRYRPKGWSRSASYAGWQVPIRTNNAYTKARIESIDDQKVRADLTRWQGGHRHRLPGCRRRGAHHHAGPRRLRHLGRGRGGRDESRRIL